MGKKSFENWTHTGARALPQKCGNVARSRVLFRFSASAHWQRDARHHRVRCHQARVACAEMRWRNFSVFFPSSLTTTTTKHIGRPIVTASSWGWLRVCVNDKKSPVNAWKNWKQIHWTRVDVLVGAAFVKYYNFVRFCLSSTWFWFWFKKRKTFSLDSSKFYLNAHETNTAKASVLFPEKCQNKYY